MASCHTHAAIFAYSRPNSICRVRGYGRMPYPPKEVLIGFECNITKKITKYEIIALPLHRKQKTTEQICQIEK